MALTSPPVTRATLERIIRDRLAPVLQWARRAYAEVTNIPVVYGEGTPEGNVTAPLGYTYHRLDSTGGTHLWVKETGGEGWENATNTGWSAK